MTHLTVSFPSYLVRPDSLACSGRRERKRRRARPPLRFALALLLLRAGASAAIISSATETIAREVPCQSLWKPPNTTSGSPAIAASASTE
jgi:hypothetical protein